MRIAIALVVAAGVAAALAAPARAATLRVDFGGQVSWTYGVAQGAFALGAPVTGTLVYRTAGIDQNPDPTVGDYSRAPITQLDIQVDSYAATGDPAAPGSQLVVYDEYLVGGGGVRDGVYFRTGALGDSVAGITPGLLQFGTGLVDPGVFQADTIPRAAGLDGLQSQLPFPSGVNFLTFGPGVGDGRVEWRIEWFSVTSLVPEPGTGVMVAIGLAFATALRPRREPR